jgi:hypothetical protein
VPGIFLGGKKRPARKADNLTAVCEPIAYKMWEPRRLMNLWASTSCCSDSFTINLQRICACSVLNCIIPICDFVAREDGAGDKTRLSKCMEQNLTVIVVVVVVIIIFFF